MKIMEVFLNGQKAVDEDIYEKCETFFNREMKGFNTLIIYK